MDKARECVISRLDKLNYGNIESLDEKTIKRFEEVEIAIEEIKINSNSLFEQLKSLKPNITMITKLQNVSFSRKTIYNDERLKGYIEDAIKEIPDYFNIEKVVKLEEDYNNLKEQYDRVLVNIIDMQKLKHSIKCIKRDNESLIAEKRQLEDLVRERDAIINNLKSGSKVLKISEFERKEE